jgi:hypothetical protein
VVQRWLRSLKLTYLTADPRSLGLFRIGFGLVLLSDLYRRYEQLDFWYTNSGLLPNHTLLWRPPAGHVFSLFFVASSRGEALLGFGLCALAYALFTLGYRTRLMQLAVLVARVSLNSRLAVLENGGDMVINLLCTFTLALPLGRCFSVDAWFLALRDAQSMDARSAIDSREFERRPIVSLAMLGLILQFALIYFFNALSKQGDAWTSGQAVHYALHQDKFVTWFGVWMREHLPDSAVHALTWATLAVEWSGFALIITPLFVWRARLLAVCMLPSLHFAFALGLNLGAFSPAMMSFFPLLLTGAHWDALSAWLQRLSAPQRLEFAANDPACQSVVRLLRELDRFERITFCSSSRAGLRVCDSPDATPAAQLTALLRALPWGFAWAWALRIPGLAGGVARLTPLAAWLVAASQRRSLRMVELWSPQRESRARRFLTDGAVLVLILAIGSEIVNDNTSVPAWLRVPQPAWAKAIIEYPRLLQGWRMFAPDPPMTDTMIYVDATTAEGAHVDPYNAVASQQGFPAGNVVPVHMGQSQFFTMYSDRIALPGYAAYRQAFLEWLLNYPQRTGHRADCLTALEVYVVTDRSPPPGQDARPTPLNREKFMEYLAPAGGDCQPTQLSAASQALRTRDR